MVAVAVLGTLASCGYVREPTGVALHLPVGGSDGGAGVGQQISVVAVTDLETSATGGC